MIKSRTAIGYIRVSTAKQADEGISLDTQQARVREYCERENLQLVTIESDAGQSARKAETRVGLQAAIAAACESSGVLVVYSISRMARSVVDAYSICRQLDDAGADLVSVTEPIDTTSAMGRAFFAILAVLAELESDLIGERVAAVNARTVEELGYRRQGVQPYGSKLVEGQRVMEFDEANVLAQIIELREAGATCREISKRLNVVGVPTLSARRSYRTGKGTTWHAGTVYQLLKKHRPDLCRSGAVRESRHKFTARQIKMLGTMPDGHVAKKLNIPRHDVIAERQKHNIPAFTKPRKETP